MSKKSPLHRDGRAASSEGQLLTYWTFKTRNPEADAAGDGISSSEYYKWKQGWWERHWEITHKERAKRKIARG